MVPRTICAICSGTGIGGISVTRLSGPQAFEIAKQSCTFLKSDMKSHTVAFGLFKDPATHSAIDQVVVTYFAQDKSFTGEETVEISSHGGAIVPRRIVDQLILNGAELAKPGEFTMRAFLNGRMDLVQAEGILGLIHSQSDEGAKRALRQLKGELSQSILKIEDDVSWVLAQLEANIDFSAEGLEFATLESIQTRMSRSQSAIDQLLQTYKTGQILNEGFQVALIGPPNVGKSSLLNALLKEDRAIVSEYAGTTRDLVEGRVYFKGQLFNIVDTAGLRESVDPVEVKGIERTRKKLREVDCVIEVIDATQPDLLEIEEAQARIRVYNKSDCSPEKFSDGLNVSAKTGDGISLILEQLLNLAHTKVGEFSGVSIQSRHLECLTRAKESLVRAQTQIHKSPDLVAFEMQDALLAIYEILGKKFDDQIMDRVFKEFCLGK